MGIYTISKPSAASASTGASADGCSVRSVIILLPARRFLRASEKIARLFASVPPEVKVRFSGLQPKADATCLRAFSSMYAPSLPALCDDDGLP